MDAHSLDTEKRNHNPVLILFQKRNAVSFSIEPADLEPVTRLHKVRGPVATLSKRSSREGLCVLFHRAGEDKTMDWSRSCDGFGLGSRREECEMEILAVCAAAALNSVER
jgi:hypothetical protein